MKKPITIVKILLTVSVFLNLGACKKQDDFLNGKPNQSLIVPTTLSDYQAILNNSGIFNQNGDPALGELSSDDFYVPSSVLSVRTAIERNAYVWAPGIYDADQTPGDWSQPYEQVYYANTVLDGLKTLKPAVNEQQVYNQAKGAALFYRAYAFYNLVQTFALPYNAGTAASIPGIPLRLSADVTIKSTRASEKACYDQIINDLTMALPLLIQHAVIPTQPSQIAANAMLARVYLAMSDYTHAFKYADACLGQYHTLNDYNLLTNPTTTSVSSGFIDEDIYHSTLVNYSTLAVRRDAIIDSNLYALYDSNDLRKTKFFTKLSGFQRFIGSYDFNGYKFSGLAVDEVYLIRAECYARQGDIPDAMTDLNTLLTTRWVAGTYQHLTALTSAAALQLILTERRKELPFRGIRWTDLRRLNLDPVFKIDLQRNLDGTIYSLPAGDPKYALPIPDAEINLSGLAQNPR